MNRVPNVSVRHAIRNVAVVYGVVWLACLVLYWGSLAFGGLSGGTIMGYMLLVLYVALPVAGSVASFLIGRSRCFGGWRFLAPFASAVLYLIFIGVTFDLSTALGLTNIAPADVRLAACVLAFSFLGLAIGMGVDALARAKR